MSRSKRAALEALIAEATVDCYNDGECVTGFYTMLEDNLALPFQTVVLGVEVAVLDLPVPTPPPQGAEWLDAYRIWVKGT